jgi:hypothetical protein
MMSATNPTNAGTVKQSTEIADDGKTVDFSIIHQIFIKPVNDHVLNLVQDVVLLQISA